MRSFRFILAIAPFLLALLPLPAAAQNILNNPDFEAGLTGWSTWTAPPGDFWDGVWLHQNDCDIWTPPSACPYAGTLSHSQEKGSGAGNTHGGIYQVLAVQQGRQYRVSGFWSGGVQANIAGSATWWEVTVYDGAVADAVIDQGPGPNDTLIAKREAPALAPAGVFQFDWEPFTGIFTAPSNTVTLAFKTGSFYTFEAAAYHDDLVVELLDQPAVEASKTATYPDDGGDGQLEPGETIRYTVVITNPVDADALDLLGVTFTDTPGANSTLVAGSVTTSQGTVTSGNTAGDTVVGVDIGSVADGNSVTITFDVLVDDPVPLNTSSIANQGTVSGRNFPDVLTDDPSQPGAADPTASALTLLPAVTATKSDALLNDVDGDGNADPGDTIRYTVIVTNSGNGAANGVLLTDNPDANTTLVAGSVTTSSGSVTAGNTAGDASVSVSVGTLAGLGGAATITFDVTIDAPLPPDTVSVSNQGTVSGSNFAGFSTDDPAAGGAADPTLTAIVLTPLLSATKVVAVVGGDGSGAVRSGDTLRYTITITNGGTGSALDLVFTDTPDANTTLVPGSVTTSAGSVTTGNAPGATSLSVAVGTLTAGTSATVTFDVTVDDGLVEVESISNQGLVTGSNVSDVPTDDPATGAAGDPTLIALVIPSPIPVGGNLLLFALAVLLSVTALVRIRP
jgi:uncharacterized repeat protein (TIGR01451 family)